MLAVEQAGRDVDVVAGGKEERPADPVAEDDVLDGWIALLTADQFERVLASLAPVESR